MGFPVARGLSGGRYTARQKPWGSAPSREKTPLTDKMESTTPSEPYTLPVEEGGGLRMDLVFLGVFLLLAIITRFWGLGTKDLWFDEVQSVYDGMYPRARGMSHWMFFPIMQFFRGFVEDVTFGVRIYPALLGALAVPMAYWVTRRLYNVEAGVVAATLLLTSPFHLNYSQEARYYAPMVFFSFFAIWMLVEFATRRGRLRFLFLPPALLACWMNVGHHPTTIPFSAALLGVGLLAICISRWGFDALRELIPPMGKAPALRWILPGVGLVLLMIALLLLPDLRRRIHTTLFETPWGETPNVDLTWLFFRRHLEEFGWNLIHWEGGIRIFGAIFSLVAIVGGTVILLVRRTSFGMLFPAILVTCFLAVFAVSIPEATYLIKYSCAMMPVFVILIAVAIGHVAAMVRGLVPTNRPWLLPAFALAPALLLTIGQSKGMIRYFELHKMPIRVQLEWVNENREERARVFVYGHAGYVAALYHDTLESRHELVYLPRNTRSQGHAEVEQLLGAALEDGESYFAKCWHWDIPPVLGMFLKNQAEVVASFRSFEHPTRTGFLHRIRHPNEGEFDVYNRPGGSFSHAPVFPIPEVDRRGDDGERGLVLRNAARVEYGIPLQGGNTYRIEVDITPHDPRLWGFSIETPEGEGLLFLVDQATASPTTLHGYLTPKSDADRLQLTHLTDFQHLGVPDNGLVIEHIRVGEVDREGAPSPGVIAMPELRELPFDQGDDPLISWQKSPAGFATARPGNEEAPAIVTLEKGPDGHLLTPAIRVQPGGLLLVRARVRPQNLFGVGGNVAILFLNEQGQAISQQFLASPSWSSTIRWHLVERPLFLDHDWHELTGLRQVPPGTSRVVISLPFWKVGNRFFTEADNELHLAPIQLAVLPGPTRQ